MYIITINKFIVSVPRSVQGQLQLLLFSDCSITVWQLSVQVLTAFRAPCIVVGIVLTELLRLYADSPCTRLLL